MPHADTTVAAIKARILAEHRKYAPCGMYGHVFENPEAWAEIAARKILGERTNI